MIGEDVIVATINEFDKRIVKGIVTMMGTIIADTLDTEEQIEEAKASLDRINGWMEKRGSRYLRYALYNATKYVCHWNPVFAEYLAKKRAEGKHYNVALSHATKKLVRLIYALQKSGKAYLVAA